jgi:hypothetical protein
MQQWEYLEVAIGGHWDENLQWTQASLWADSQGRGGRFQERKVSFDAPKLTGTFRKSEKPVRASVLLRGHADLLDDLGAEGWELVTASFRKEHAAGYLLL